MPYFSARVGAALLALSWMSFAASAQSRVALVIGNSAYQTVLPLTNPAKDAKLVSAFLKSADFEVTALQDLSQREMREAISRFGQTLSRKGPNTVVVVYYAGHALQVDGENFLVPTDARIVRETDVPLEAVRLNDLMTSLTAASASTRIIMLDACRANPFAEIGSSIGHGLAIVNPPPGTIVSYATSPGTETSDGEGTSPYLSAFLAAAKEPGVPIEQAFKSARFSVNVATNRQQLPWEISSLTTNFSFFAGADEVSAARGSYTLASGLTNPAAETSRKERRPLDIWKRDLVGRSAGEAFKLVTEEDSIEGYQAYLELFQSDPASTRVREILDRRRVMVGWFTAVTLNAPPSYEAFLTDHPNTDLEPTARRMLEQSRKRGLLLRRPIVADVCPCAPAPARPLEREQQGPGQPPAERRANVEPGQAIDPLTGAPLMGAPPTIDPLTIAPPPIPKPNIQVIVPPVIYVPKPVIPAYSTPAPTYTPVPTAPLPASHTPTTTTPPTKPPVSAPPTAYTPPTYTAPTSAPPLSTPPGKTAPAGVSSPITGGASASTGGASASTGGVSTSTGGAAVLKSVTPPIGDAVSPKVIPAVAPKVIPPPPAPKIIPAVAPKVLPAVIPKITPPPVAMKVVTPKVGFSTPIAKVVIPTVRVPTLPSSAVRVVVPTVRVPTINVR